MGRAPRKPASGRDFEWLILTITEPWTSIGVLAHFLRKTKSIFASAGPISRGWECHEYRIQV